MPGHGFCQFCHRKIVLVREEGSSAYVQLDAEPQPEGSWEICGRPGKADATARRRGQVRDRKGRPSGPVLVKARIPKYTLRSIHRSFRDDGYPGEIEPETFTDEQWAEIYANKNLKVELVTAPEARPGEMAYRAHRETCAAKKCVALGCPHAPGGTFSSHCKQRPPEGVRP